MKAILTFNLPEDQREFDRAVKGDDAHIALYDIGQQVFRPARKHGYPEQELQKLLEQPGVIEAIEYLEAKFYGIINDHMLNLD